MGRRDVTDGEMAAQVCATAALQLADEHRADGDHHRHWIRVASVAIERTRESMDRRGVRMFTRKNRRSADA